MRQRAITLLVCLMTLTGAGSAHAGKSWLERAKELLEQQSASPVSTSSLSTADIASGLREALRVGTGNVVSQLGRENGFYKDARAHIPLPDGLEKIRSTLERVGMSDQLDELELRMNRAAEAATPKAKAMFISAVEQMTLDDARRIYNGPEDAATRYFQGRVSAPLAEEFRPVVQNSLAQVGAVQTYDSIMSRYKGIPLVPDIKANLSEHVVDHAITAIFDYLAAEEAAIRQNPAKRTTELLRKVFGS